MRRLAGHFAEIIFRFANVSLIFQLFARGKHFAGTQKLQPAHRRKAR